jgi:hypothetical protein
MLTQNKHIGFESTWAYLAANLVNVLLPHCEPSRITQLLFHCIRTARALSPIIVTQDDPNET